MKTILTILILLTVSACSETEYIYHVDAEYKPYVDNFYQEANNRGVYLDHNLIVSSGYTQSAVKVETTGQRSVTLSDRINPPSDVLENVIYYNLAKSFGFNPDPDNEFKPFDESNRKQFFDDIFDAN